MLVEAKKLKGVNAESEIYDDSAKPYTPERKAEIERRCTERLLPHFVRIAKESKNTA